MLGRHKNGQAVCIEIPELGSCAAIHTERLTAYVAREIREEKEYGAGNLPGLSTAREWDPLPIARRVRRKRSARCLDRTRRDHVDPEPIRPPLDGHGLCELTERCFRCAVGCMKRRSPARTDARQADQAARHAAFDHRARDRARHAPRGPEVELKQLIEGVRFIVEQRAPTGEGDAPDDIDKSREVTHRATRLIHCLPCADVAADVSEDANEFPADSLHLVGRCLHGLIRDIHPDDASPCPGYRNAHRSSDPAATCTAHENAPPIESEKIIHARRIHGRTRSRHPASLLPIVPALASISNESFSRDRGRGETRTIPLSLEGPFRWRDFAGLLLWALTPERLSMPSDADDSKTRGNGQQAETTRDRHAEYWRRNVRYLVLLTSIWFVVSFGFGIILADALNAYRIPGTHLPLGFWFAQQGAIYVFVLLIFIYVWLMNRLDREFEVDEEGDE